MKKEKTILDIEEKLTKIKDILETYKTEAIENMTVNDIEYENNFNRQWLSMHWLNRSVDWKEKVNAAESALNKAKSEALNKYLTEALYNITDKQVTVKTDADDIVQTYKKQYEAVKTVYDYCVKMQEMLRNQSFEIKARFDYQRYINGLDK